jgi:hypothetical protein
MPDTVTSWRQPGLAQLADGAQESWRELLTLFASSDADLFISA